MIDLSQTFDETTLKEWEETILTWEVEEPFNLKAEGEWVQRLEEAFADGLKGVKLDTETISHWRTKIRPMLAEARSAYKKDAPRRAVEKKMGKHELAEARKKGLSDKQISQRWTIHHWLNTLGLVAAIRLFFGVPGTEFYWAAIIGAPILSVIIRAYERRRDTARGQTTPRSLSASATELLTEIYDGVSHSPSTDLTAMFDPATLQKWEMTIAQWLREETFNVSAIGEWTQRLQAAFQVELQDVRLDSDTVKYWLGYVMRKQHAEGQ